jgi:3',5'-nucleoside bisphosphate phosphatase
MKKLCTIFSTWMLLFSLLARGLAEDVRHEIHFPNLPDYKTLKCDFHMHTVFSDGQVWPTVRVAEAWRQGLDAIVLTDHVEYQPHKEDLSTNLQRPWELAADEAKKKKLLFPRGVEITKDTPPGHYNAIFLKDANQLKTKDFVEQVKRANEQGAFVFWNHHTWKGADKGRWQDVQTLLYDNKWLHGMEVANGSEYYPEAHKWCLEKNLTMLGNTDIHEPDLRRTTTAGDHRTLTLVFVKEPTLDGLKEALKQRRTAVWHKDRLIGSKEWLAPLFDASVIVERPHLYANKTLWLKIHNRSDVDIRLKKSGGRGPTEIFLAADGTSLVQIADVPSAEPMDLTYTAVNFLIAPKTGLPVTLHIEKP